MSKAEMRETCAGVAEDYNVLGRYCEITKRGEVSALQGIIEAVFGHCDDTARKRVNYLVKTKTIIVYGKFWKFNEAGRIELQKSMDLVQSLRDLGNKDAPQETEEQHNKIVYGSD